MAAALPSGSDDVTASQVGLLRSHLGTVMPSGGGYTIRAESDVTDNTVWANQALSTDGSTDRVQLLGWNNLSDPKRPRGNLKYSIPPELALLLKDSTVFESWKSQLQQLNA